MRLIDADTLMKHIKDVPTWIKDCDEYYWVATKYPEGMYDTEDVVSSIENAPTVDAVEVVRCKDCRYWDDDRRCNGIENGLMREYTLEDDFCSYGERENE